MSRLYDAVLFDRDGTLIADVPYNGDPDRVRPMPGARAALDRLRAAGLRLGVVTNQSGLARGNFTPGQLASVHHRVEELLGPFDTWQICPHDDTAGCDCRKPRPGMIVEAARALGTTPQRCVVVGDIGRDMAAALAAGAAGILVPTPVTLPDEVDAAPAVVPDLTAAAELILHREALVTPAPRPHPAGTVLVVRSDSAGDVLVTGPAIRAVAHGSERVVLLCGPRGRAAAELLPGVDELISWKLPWIDPEPDPVAAADLGGLTERIRAAGVDEAVVFTSYHQSALPLALLLRTAGVQRITAISEDYPGSLLDVRHRVPPGVPEPERARSVAAAAGFGLPPGDDGGLRVRGDDGFPARAGGGPRVRDGKGPRLRDGEDPRVRDGEDPRVRDGEDPRLRDGEDPRVRESGGPRAGVPRQVAGGGHVVVHPGASVEARSCPPDNLRRIVRELTAAGHRVTVTAGPGEENLAAYVADAVADLVAPPTLTDLAHLVAAASCLVVGNTGPAHLAAAVGTPVISLYAPTVPYAQWGPYRVPAVRLGRAGAACRDTRATRCPVPGHPCLSTVEPAQVLDAVERLGAASLEDVA
ncbi:haloacid dehalogenase [Actinoplanes sp. SE50]|uniref:HAD-IIIA family hydrolase n=1 Tax=unclassified Actinoplanes TaxID=2626549 RepID=UPI00023EC251|nr:MULTISPECIES: HAD-IIIA family hydrolase [unclassified Actinoplanes]AEV83547.1 Epoxide hydrolase 2 [Actinoplanes sp. SE50/110]ATO82309.1 haloacid dehalogenase [Actinoplanes sp. SE50]SLL99716.1 D,D-heptose 1,7-bisphosphate phosphatase [Actinoplanes sp. SE50/110]